MLTFSQHLLTNRDFEIFDFSGKKGKVQSPDQANFDKNIVFLDFWKMKISKFAIFVATIRLEEMNIATYHTYEKCNLGRQKNRKFTFYAPIITWGNIC